MDVKIEQSWKEALKDEFEKDYFINLTNFIKNIYLEKQFILNLQIFLMLLIYVHLIMLKS